MQFALLVKQFFALLLRLHLRREAFGHEETVALRHICRTRDALFLKLKLSLEVYEFRVQVPHAVLRGGELDTVDVPLLGELFLEALAPPPQLGHGGGLRLWGLARTPFG